MLVAGATAWLVHERNEQRQEDQDCNRFAQDDIKIQSLDYFGPAWLKRLLPDSHLEFFAATELCIGADAPNNRFEIETALRQFPYLDSLSILNGFRLEELDHSILSKIETLHLYKGSVEADWAIATIPRLRKLQLYECAIADEVLESLEKCDSLEELQISNCTLITERGVRSLLNVPKLKSLWIGVPPNVSDETIQLLETVH